MHRMQNAHSFSSRRHREPPRSSSIWARLFCAIVVGFLSLAGPVLGRSVRCRRPPINNAVLRRGDGSRSHLLSPPTPPVPSRSISFPPFALIFVDCRRPAVMLRPRQWPRAISSLTLSRCVLVLVPVCLPRSHVTIVIDLRVSMFPPVSGSLSRFVHRLPFRLLPCPTAGFTNFRLVVFCHDPRPSVSWLPLTSLLAQRPSST